MKEKSLKQLVIYQSKNGAIEFRGDFRHNTVWGTQKQIADVFGIERSVVTKHINKVLKIREVNAKSNVQKMHIANSDKLVKFYSLDIILAVGYRTNSAKAINFRKWATKTLREHIIKGYTINRKQIAKNYDSFMQSVESIQNLLPEHITLDPKLILELIKEFASTWTTLDAYDKEELTIIGSTKKAIKLSGAELQEAIVSFRTELIERGEATELFA